MDMAVEIRRSTRVRELSRMNKARVKNEYDRVLAQRGIRVLLGNGSKDEMINDILHYEFPR